MDRTNPSRLELALTVRDREVRERRGGPCGCREGRRPTPRPVPALLVRGAGGFVQQESRWLQSECAGPAEPLTRSGGEGLRGVTPLPAAEPLGLFPYQPRSRPPLMTSRRDRPSHCTTSNGPRSTSCPGWADTCEASQPETASGPSAPAFCRYDEVKKEHRRALDRPPLGRPGATRPGPVRMSPATASSSSQGIVGRLPRTPTPAPPIRSAARCTVLHARTSPPSPPAACPARGCTPPRP